MSGKCSASQKEQILELIHKNADRRFAKPKFANISTKMNSIEESDIEKYELTEDTSKSCFINSFHKINWPEPFTSPDNLSALDKVDIELN